MEVRGNKGTGVKELAILVLDVAGEMELSVTAFEEREVCGKVDFVFAAWEG